MAAAARELEGGFRCRCLIPTAQIEGLLNSQGFTAAALDSKATASAPLLQLLRAASAGAASRGAVEQPLQPSS